MDLEAAETAHIRDKQIVYSKTKWLCPCQGCTKAAKKEREKIADELVAGGFTEAAEYIMIKP